MPEDDLQQAEISVLDHILTNQDEKLTETNLLLEAIHGAIEKNDPTQALEAIILKMSEEDDEEKEKADMSETNELLKELVTESKKPWNITVTLELE